MRTEGEVGHLERDQLRAAESAREAEQDERASRSPRRLRPQIDATRITSAVRSGAAWRCGRLPWVRALPGPRAFFTDAGLTALRQLLLDRRAMDPARFGHLRAELGLDG